MILVDTSGLYALAKCRDAHHATARRAFQEVYTLLDVPHDVLALASAIDRRYAGAALGFVDCTCLALCGRHRITTVCTYDRRHFSLYRPTFTRALTLVP